VLTDVVLVGSRSGLRSLFGSPIPIDVVSAAELKTTGEISLDLQLQLRAPSFNTVNKPVSDATSLFDPYEIRNMGSSRTLVMINGKRKNLSSLLFLQPTIGRGETGTDLTAIPTSAIGKVEILRDGASAQYGSDAVAGVINIVLKKDTVSNSVELHSGITNKMDGFYTGLTYNNIFNVLPKWKLEGLDPVGETYLSDPLRRQLLEGGLTFNGRYRILGYYGSQFSQLGTTFATTLKIDL
jgi:iron complex outermembrane receptor protein